MLDVPRNATQEQIDSAFAKLTEQLGATTNVRGAAASKNQLNMIRDGYKILSDPEKRVMYDAKLHATEHGIKLMFFPKDKKSVKKLGIETFLFSVLACVFTYVVYQKLLVHEAASVSVEQVKADKQIPPTPIQAAIPAAQPATPPAASLATPPDAKAITKADEKK